MHTSARGSPAARALAGGLGVAGVVAEVTLALEPLSTTQAVTTTGLGDAGLAGEVAVLAAAADAGSPLPHVALLWRPDVGKYNRYVLKAKRKDAHGGGGGGEKAGHGSDGEGGGAHAATHPTATRSTTSAAASSLSIISGPSFTGPTPPPEPQAVGAIVKALQADANDTAAGAAAGGPACATNAALLAVQQWAAVGLVPLPEGEGLTQEVVSNWANPKATPWSYGLTVDEIGFAFEAADFEEWVADVRAIIAADLGGGAPTHCMPLVTLIVRFGRPSDADTAPTAGLVRPVIVALALLRSRSLPAVPAKAAWVQDYVEQLTLCKYRGRPDWGKNWGRTFTRPDCPVRDAYPPARFDALLAAQAAADPGHAFEPPLFAAVAARGGPVSTGPRCALEKLCYCSRDEQCAPGWVCRRGRAFPQYTACVPSGLKWGKEEGR